MHHIALCCLEGSTMSNLVHRRRRCARIVSYMILLPGGQYARGQGRSLHQAKDIVVAPWEPFCTANGSHFALWHSVCQGQTRRVGRFSQASLLAWMNITAWLQGRKPRESNKLFDLFLPKSESVLSVVEQKLPEEREGLSLFIALRWMQKPWRGDDVAG